MLNTVNHASPPYVLTALTAIGSSQSTAFALVNNAMHEFTNVASSTGAILPVGQIPSVISVYNSGSNALAIYPPVGGTIDDGSVNASVSVAPTSGASYWVAGPTTWYDVQTAGSGGSGITALTGNVTASGSGSVAATIASSVPLAGSPTTTTQSGSDNSTKIATTAFVAACTTISAAHITTGTLPAGQLPTTGLVVTQADWVIQTPADGSTVNFDLSAGNCFMPAAMAGNRALTLTNAPASSPFVRPFTVILTQDSTGSRTITSWFSGFTVRWSGGSAPTLTTTANKSDLFVFVQIGATTLLGSVGGQNY